MQTQQQTQKLRKNKKLKANKMIEIWTDISQTANMYTKLLHPTDRWGNANQNQGIHHTPN